MSNLQLYFKSSFMEDDLTIDSGSGSFEVSQKELFLKEILQDGKHKYDVSNIQYSCKWEQGENWTTSNKNEACLIVPIRDDYELLDYTINNLKKHKILDSFSLIVIDDRSKTDEVKKVALSSGCSYLRVDNKKGFNFSMLCNLGAYVAKTFGDFRDVIMWNSDLWVSNSTDLIKVLKQHREVESKITGAKLIYPTFSWNNSEEKTNNMKISFQELGFDPAGTVQFGGGTILSGPNGMMMPEHIGRFQPSDYKIVDHDSPTKWVTGALHVINIDWFVKNGGYNPSLSKAYQDVDLCLRAVLQNELVYYSGKGVTFYHDESLQHCTTDTSEKTTLEEIQKNKFDGQFASDMHLFSRLWVPNIHFLMTGDRRIEIKPVGAVK